MPPQIQRDRRRRKRRSGANPPTTDVPPPNGTTAIRCSEQIPSTAMTSSCEARQHDQVGGVAGISRP